MKRFIVLFALFAPSVFADPDIDAIARRLASEDPAVRDAARKELLALDEDSAPALLAAAAKTSDLEARAALREIAEIIADRRYLDCAKGFAEPAAKRDLRVEVVSLWNVHPVSVFLCWAGEPERILNELALENGDPENGDKIQPDLLRKTGFRWLRAWTLADIGDDLRAWRAFAARTRRLPWTELRLEGLAVRGFRVLDADPAVAIAELVAAWRPDDAARPGGKRRTIAHVSSIAADSYARLLRDLFRHNPGAPFPPPDTDAVLDWVEASRGHFTRERKDRFTTTAGPDDFLASLKSDRLGTRLAALTELERWPDRIPAGAWELADADAERVGRAMSLAKHTIPAGRLPSFLEAMSPWTDPKELAGIWSADDLSAVVVKRENTAVRERALKVLRAVDAGRAKTASRTALEEYFAVPVKGEKSLVAEAALVLAKSGRDADRKLAERWLVARSSKHLRFSLALALARQGSRAGFDLVLERVREDVLPDAQLNKIRKFAPGAPAGVSVAKWQKWGSRAKTWEWNAKSRRWEAGR